MGLGQTAVRSFARLLLGRFVVALAVALPVVVGRIVAVVVGRIVAVNVFIDRKIASIPRVKLKTAEDTDPGAPANFLLIGSDSRSFADLTPEEQQSYGSPVNASGQRSDTLMVIHVDPRQKTGFLVSFPRDLEVNIPGLGQ